MINDYSTPLINPQALFSFSYGLFVLSARSDERDNACIINTAMQVTNSPTRISITVNKANYTHDMILENGLFNISILTEDSLFATFQCFGFRSGRNVDKFAGIDEQRSNNGLRYLTGSSNAFISGKVLSTIDCETHTIFIADVTEAVKLSNVKSLTYEKYFSSIKPKPQPATEKRAGYVCKICGYIHEGLSLPDDFICPICKHGASDFELIV